MTTDSRVKFLRIALPIIGGAIVALMSAGILRYAL
jgi:hypothetical protein